MTEYSYESRYKIRPITNRLLAHRRIAHRAL